MRHRLILLLLGGSLLIACSDETDELGDAGVSMDAEIPVWVVEPGVPTTEDLRYSLLDIGLSYSSPATGAQEASSIPVTPATIIARPTGIRPIRRPENTFGKICEKICIASSLSRFATTGTGMI